MQIFIKLRALHQISHSLSFFPSRGDIWELFHKGIELLSKLQKLCQISRQIHDSYPEQREFSILRELKWDFRLFFSALSCFRSDVRKIDWDSWLV